jgi:hypothetical protein
LILGSDALTDFEKSGLAGQRFARIRIAGSQGMNL